MSEIPNFVWFICTENTISNKSRFAERMSASNSNVPSGIIEAPATANHNYTVHCVNIYCMNHIKPFRKTSASNVAPNKYIN